MSRQQRALGSYGRFARATESVRVALRAVCHTRCSWFSHEGNGVTQRQVADGRLNIAPGDLQQVYPDD
jgi:hypothetical protein